MILTVWGCRSSAVLLLGLTMVSIAAGQRSPATASQPAAKLPRIAGTVVNAVTGNPLARARVSLQDARNPQNLRWTITSEDGRFEFAQLAPGKYAMRGAKRGFLAAGYEQHEQFSTAIVSGVGLDTEHLVLRLAPVAVLSGRVLNEAGEPVRHATVSLYVEDRSAGVDRIQRVRDESTDDQGSYEFWPLGAGTYFLAATASPWYALQLSSFGQPDRAEPSPTFDPSLDAAYPVTYYKDASEPDEASPIPLRGGDNLEADFHLNPVPALHLRFRVSDVELHGFIMPRLLKPSFDGIQDVPFHGMGTVSPGIFEIAGVPAGRYVVQMSRSQPPGQPIETDAVELDLNADGQELDSSSGTPAGSVHAAAKLKGQEQLPRQLRILLRNSRRRVVDEQEINDTGEVEFRNLAPGKYELLAWAPGEAYSVLRISLAGEEIAGDVLPVTAGSSLAISILLAGSAMRVEGFAKRKGQPVPGAMVVLVPETPASNRDLFRRDQSDLDGSFSLRNVIPGSYTVCAIADGWDLDWAKPAVIASYCKHGRPVVVPDRAEGSIELESFVEVESR